MTLQQIRNGIYGLAVADAVGVPAEFNSREKLKKAPITDMVGHGTHDQPAGTWSDDTSMAICLAASLAEKQCFSADDIMQRFGDWLVNGAYTPHGDCFDCGITSSGAVYRYLAGMPALECGGAGEFDNGNGSLMRILPMAIFLVKQYGFQPWANDEAMDLIHAASSLTHRHVISLSACGIYVCIAAQLLGGRNLNEAILTGTTAALEWYEKQDFLGEAANPWNRLHDLDDFAKLDESKIKSSGYVVDTLEAAIWCLLNTHDYRSCVLKAVNLGNDTDTVAAVAGGLAGLAYGFGDDGIPQNWMNGLQAKQILEDVCIGLSNLTGR